MYESKVYLSDSLKDRLDSLDQELYTQVAVELSIDNHNISNTRLLSTQFAFSTVQNKKLCMVEFSTSADNIPRILQCSIGLSVILRQDKNVIMHEFMSFQDQEIIVDMGEIVDGEVVVQARLNI